MPINFYTDDNDVEHFWPEKVRNWEFLGADGCDRFEMSCTEGEYQHDTLNTIVTFSAPDLETSGKPGTWSYREGGKPYSGKFKDETEIPRILAKITKDVMKLRATAVKSLESKMKMPGYEVDRQGFDYAFMKELTVDYAIMFDVMDVDDLLGGDEVMWHGRITDSGGYKNAHFLEREGRVSSLEDLLKKMKQYDRDATQFYEKRLKAQASVDRAVISSLCRAGREDLAKSFARFRGYVVR